MNDEEYIQQVKEEIAEELLKEGFFQMSGYFVMTPAHFSHMLRWQYEKGREHERLRKAGYDF